MTDALTPDDLARIGELAEKATPGPWDADAVRPFAEIAPADARFVSAARTAVPALVAGVRSLQARITELEKQLAQSDRAFNKVYERNAELIMEIWELELKNAQKENDNH